jgi:hypothetical protein
MKDIKIKSVYNNEMKRFDLVLVANSKGLYNILEIYNDKNKCIDGIFLDTFQSLNPESLTQTEELKKLVNEIINRG